MRNCATILLAKCVVFVLINAQLSLNDRCQVARSGTNGICRYYEDCPVVLNELLDHGLTPTKCGFQDRKEIICCPLPPTKKPITSSIMPNRASEKKCIEYQDAVNERVFSSVGLSGPPIEQKVFRCSIATVPLIVGGENALAKEFPHMALIGFEGRVDKSISWKCGGSLISDFFVLSAAHCMYAPGIGPASHVLLGDLNYGSDNDDAQPRQFIIIERIKHPDFKLPSKYNDIALLRINGPVQFSNYIRPACLPQTKSIDSHHVIASGWGRVNYSSTPSEQLQKVVLELFTQRECNQTYSNEIGRQLSRGIDVETQLCAGSHDSRKDTCQGDSGGPIQTYHARVSCMYTLVGVTSFGKVCGTQGTPGVYTRVYTYLQWIEDIVWPN
ncbi:venom protease-like [Sitodiplosis mosellana]|uniref:venom protease-like n=1 Tax=Sitodiplosis mosellana TaxID=263140 RepID=UPI002444280A|nr:venom protease-like [Sitodiplosis mosellana]